MTNAVGAIVAMLKADTALSAAVSSRVYGGELPKAQITDMPRAAVVVSRAGGGFIGGGYQDYGDLRINVACYADTPRAADIIYGLVHDALKQMRRGVWSETLLHWANVSSEGVTGRDPDTDWPVCLSSWQVLASEVAAA